MNINGKRRILGISFLNFIWENVGKAGVGDQHQYKTSPKYCMRPSRGPST